MYFIKQLIPHFKYIKLDFIKYCLLNILSTLIEVLGIVSVFPLISLLNNKNFINENFLIQKFIYYSGIDDFNSIFVIAGITTVLLFTLTSFFKVYLIKFQSYFVYNYSYIYSIQLLKVQLKKNLNWFNNQEASNLIKDTIDETSVLVSRIIVPSANFICSLINCLVFFFILLFFSNIFFILIFFLAIIPYLLLSRVFAKKLEKAGDTRFENNKKRYEILSNIYQGIKEIKSRSLEKKFFEYYKKIVFDYNKSVQVISVLSQSPRYLLELIFVIISVLILTLITVFLKIDTANLISTLTVLMLSILRLIPQLQLVYKNYSDLKFFLPSLKNMPIEKYNFREKLAFNEDLKKNLKFESSIELKNIYFSFGNKKILNDANFIINKSKIIGIKGASGSGKTTLLNILMGLIKIDQGKVTLDSVKIDIFNNTQYKKIFAYVPQDCFLLNDTIKKNITLLSDDINISDHNYKINEKIFNEVISLCQLRSVIDENKNKENMIIGDNGKLLSGGERQRVGIARSLYMQPQILILDESTSAIDKENEKKILDNLTSRTELTKIIISHDNEVLEKCNELYEVKNNKIIKIK